MAAKQHATQVDIGTSSWVTNAAPRPAEIYWENFGLDSGTKMNNAMKSVLLTCAMFFLFVFVSCGAAYCIGCLGFHLVGLRGWSSVSLLACILA